MMEKYFLLMIICCGIPGYFCQEFRQYQKELTKLCPNKCRCLQTTVSCTLQKLTTIPRVPDNTTVLDLRFNEIMDIPAGIFENLPNLNTLILNDNQIKYLQKDAFRGCWNLKLIYLFKNQIERIEPGAFDNLAKLEHLYLHYNYLTEIRKGTFNNLPALQKISLQNNDIRRIEFDAFRNIGPAMRLQMNTKALECTCNLMWLIEHIKKLPHNEMNAACDSPDDLKGKRLDSIEFDDLHCSKPRIMEEPEDRTVDVGETIKFHCRVAGDPVPDVKWMRDSTEVPIDGEHYKMMDDNTLMIIDANENDNGDYECVAHNDMGFINSRKARALIAIPEFLHFIEIPISQTVEAGVDVTFTCKVEGDSIVEWWKNGRLIAAGGRFQFEDRGAILKIQAAKQSDSARYVCRAKGGEGLAETSADLNVLREDFRPPEMTYQPQDMEVESGASIEIPCRARGNPKPTMHWKKDGIALDASRNIPLDRNRFRLSKGGSLYLYNISAQDAGRYECSAINEHGRATGQALLQIRKAEASDAIVLRAFQEARSEIDRAINNTLQSLFGGQNAQHHKDLFRMSRFPSAEGRAAARPAELFERTLQNIRRLVRSGTFANVTDQFIYDEILTREQIIEIERLSGCTAHRRKDNCNNLCFHKRYRTFDGRCNNFENPTWGSSYTGFRRILKPIYENGFSTPVGWDKNRLYHGHRKPAARLVSTSLISTHNITSDDSITHMVMQWGQFLDHDLDHALPAVSSETWDGIDCKKSCDNAPPCFPMEVPPNDPRVTNRRCIDFFRTSAVCGSGETSVLWGKLTPREQLNQLTSYLDASQVYGYDDDVARDLRDLTTDRGLLREGPNFPNRKPLLPYASGQFVDCRRDPLESSINCFLTGDFRANEQVGLLAMHTIWMREHNRIARRLFEINPHWRGEKLYQEARKIVGAEMQHITFNNWIPTVLGGFLESYRGYNSKLDATISNVFATAALRFGHSLIQPRLERLDDKFSSIPQGPLDLRDAFFSPWRLVEEGGVDPLIRGMFATAAKLKLPEQNLNIELTEQLFRVAHAVALDLAAMNIQRSRDHAIPGYLEWRKYCNMSSVETFENLKDEISSERVREKLQELYGHPGNIDVWVGGILEDQLPNAKVGPLFKCLLTEQFQRMRDADRFWYESPSTFKSEQLEQIKLTTLARILCDNGDNITRIQRDIFHLPSGDNPIISCDEIPELDLRLWNECCEDCQDQPNDITRFRRSAAIKYSNSENLMSFNFQSELNRDEKMEFIHHLLMETDEKNELLKKLTNDVTENMSEIKSLLHELERER